VLLKFALGGTAVVLIEADGSTTHIASKDSLAPDLGAGAKFKTLRIPALSGDERTTFGADLAPGFGTVTASNASAVFAEDVGLNLHLRQQRTDAAPGGQSFSAFGNPALNSAGAIAFSAKLSGAVTTLDNLGLWSGGALVARKNGEPAGIPGAHWLSFTGFGLPDSGGTIFAGKLMRNLGGVTALDDVVLSAVDSTGVERLILRKGQSIAVGSGSKIIAAISPLTLVPTSAAQRRAFNNARVIVTAVRFTDNTQAIVRSIVP
jgi:hypothetical protein